MLLAQASQGLPHGLVLAYYVAGILVGLGVLGTLWVKWIWPAFRRITNFLNDWEGEPARERDGVPERPGVMKRLSLVEYDIGAIKKELHPDHGGSIKDVTTETAKTVSRIEQAINGDT